MEEEDAREPSPRTTPAASDDADGARSSTGGEKTEDDTNPLHRRRRRRRRLLRSYAPQYERYTNQRTGGRGCGGRRMAHVENENFGKDPHVAPAPRPDESVLVECLRSGPSKCGAAARAAARRLPSVLMMPPVGVRGTSRADLGAFDLANPPPGNGDETKTRPNQSVDSTKVNHAAVAKAGVLPQGSNGTHMFPAVGLSGGDGMQPPDSRNSSASHEDVNASHRATTSSTTTTRFKSCAAGTFASCVYTLVHFRCHQQPPRLSPGMSADVLFTVPVARRRR